jgi:Zn-dependent protease
MPLPGFDLERLILIVPAILIAITIHEFSHAAAAYALGDPTAKAEGRLSLNPLVHLDPLGTLMIVFTAIAGVGIGWGRPVPVNPYRMRVSPRAGMALSSLAGPASNILTAFLLVLPMRLDLFSYSSLGRVEDVIYYVVFISIGLGAFNLLPLPPLDGFSVALGVLPRAAASALGRLAQYGPGVLMAVLMIDWFTPIPVLNTLLRPLFALAGAIVGIRI